MTRNGNFFYKRSYVGIDVTIKVNRRKQTGKDNTKILLLLVENHLFSL